MKKYFEFSKLILYFVSATYVYFVSKILNNIFSSSSDYSNWDIASICVAIITVTGGMLTMAEKYYYNKSCSENVIKNQRDFYKNIMESRLIYNEKMIRLKIKYKLTDQQLNEIESSSPITDSDIYKVTNITEQVINEDINNSTNVNNIQN